MIARTLLAFAVAAWATLASAGIEFTFDINRSVGIPDDAAGRTTTKRQTTWPPCVTVTVTCPSDNKTASDTVNIQVTRRPVRTYTFEDVYFDFDRYSLRPEATRVLDEAIAAMRENTTLRVELPAR